MSLPATAHAPQSRDICRYCCRHTSTVHSAAPMQVFIKCMPGRRQQPTAAAGHYHSTRGPRLPPANAAVKARQLVVLTLTIPDHNLILNLTSDLNPWSGQQQLRSIPLGMACRQSLRAKDGSWSPAAFSPVPKSSASRAPPVSHLLPAAEGSFLLDLVLHLDAAPGTCIDQLFWLPQVHCIA